MFSFLKLAGAVDSSGIDGIHNRQRVLRGSCLLVWSRKHYASETVLFRDYLRSHAEEMAIYGARKFR